MIINNENKSLSRNSKRRIERKMKMDDTKKPLLTEIKTGMKNKTFDKMKQLEIELVKIKYANNPYKLQSELKELNKVHIIDQNLRQIKNEILGDYVGEFEMVGRLKTADQTRETHFRVTNKDDFESYNNANDQD